MCVCVCVCVCVFVCVVLPDRNKRSFQPFANCDLVSERWQTILFNVCDLRRLVLIRPEEKLFSLSDVSSNRPCIIYVIDFGGMGE